MPGKGQLQNSISSCSSWGGLLLRGLQNQLLRPPQLNFGNEQLVGIAAIDFVQSAKLAQLLAGLAELADHGSVQLHLVNLAGVIGQSVIVVIRKAVGGEQILMRARRDA